ncbi:hypothetical protein UO65_0176 [Actinokineospora spheciospongiae]|uniref:Lantibiotic dehydratase N-terminal domain-containing protein n=1 Tax=Actinokineospora spheciospongiae TaxID=909613 RepID=W7JEZ9_9PSEU|nr:hypothetical protein [Actinokineospora spheciospongiae]EWC64569.1 hypothetical protein UO65_0176 [Actinokineospora spheciospongiae]
MSADFRPEGPAGLLRVSGVPAALVAEAGNPGLFDALRRLSRDEADHRSFAAALAERVSAELVPHPDLSAPVRTSAITLRRQLTRGEPVDGPQCRRLAVVGVALGVPQALTDDLVRAATWSTALTTARAECADAVLAERSRLAALPWELVTDSPTAARVVSQTAPEVLDEIRGRLAAGERWTDKRLRQRADYLLRLLSRAALKTTPRGWLGQVALVGVAPDRDTRLLPGFEVTDYAVHSLSNIQADRRVLATAADLPDAWLSITGLHWVRGARLCCWVADHDSTKGLRLVRVRRTPAVDAVRHLLGPGALRTADVVRLLAPEDRHHPTVRAFLRHLAGLGVLQLSAQPVSNLRDWSPNPRGVVADRGFVDVYRRGRGHVPAAAVTRLAGLVAQAGRLGAVLAEDAGGTGGGHPVLDLVGPEPRPASEVVAEFLDGAEHRPPTPPATEWPEPRPGGAYQRLADWLAGHADADEVDIDAAALDRVGAPPAALPPWPVDCLVRPLPGDGPVAVLEAVLPAGVLDARFADALHQLHGRVPQVEDYRGFLAEVTTRCGAEVVEVLVPPQDDRSANAVRRPRYTRTWTGDADLSTYFAGQAGPGRYLPLDRVLVRRRDGRVVAEDADGKPLWPVCHATRTPMAPWDVVVALLSAAAPIGHLAAPLLLGDPAAAFPGRARTPRLVLDGGLVIAGATVRVERAALPSPGDPVVERVRRLADLRAATGAPRWNFVRAAGGRRPRPVDLDSVTALRVFDRLLADPAVPALVLEEMLPDPEHLPVRDELGQGLAAQLVIRLPADPGLARVADRAARAWRGLSPPTEAANRFVTAV